MSYFIAIMIMIMIIMICALMFFIETIIVPTLHSCDLLETIIVSTLNSCVLLETIIATFHACVLLGLL